MVLPLDILTAVVLATQMRARDVREVTSTQNVPDVVGWAASIASRPGEKWALFVDDRPVAMGGAIALWPGVVQTWLAATDELPRFAVPLLRTVRESHARMIAAGVHRFQTWRMVGDAVALRWLERLGYQVEGRCRRMGRNGEDFDVMARIVEGDARG